MAATVAGLLGAGPSVGAVAPPEVAAAPLLAPAPVCGSSAGTGHTSITTSDGAAHRYYWRIPSTPAPANGRPVLIWLHGDGGTGAGLASSFWSATDPDGAIIVTPNGTDQTWNHRAGDVPGTPYDSQFLSKVIDQLRTCASVDKFRIFVGGASRGAYMPYYLLMRSSTHDLIAGIAVNAGLLYCQADDPECVDASDPVRHSSAARIIHLHGTNDTSVSPPPTATYHHPVDWSVDWRVFWPMRYWSLQHGCSADDPDDPNDSGKLRETYTTNGHTARVYDLTGHGPACAGYQLILVTNGGHVIGGQEQRIWKFLMAGKRNGCRGRVPTLVGSERSDTLTGTAGPDTIVGLGGDDTISGLGGGDRICGGEGGDVIAGGGNDDELVGGPGRDKLYGSGGADYLDAADGESDPKIDCGAGADPAAHVDGTDPGPISCG